MAWRIDEHVVQGEIDNRVRGLVVGRIWLAGAAEPVVLELKGNCWRDLAGRRLEFANPQPKPGLPEGFAPRQEGVVGDITASRKVKVPDIPLDQIHLYYKTGRDMPWHWGNSLYLEWISQRNGRVVIESASYELKIVGDATWEMNEAEELEQRRANGAALIGFMDRLAEAVDVQQGKAADVTPEEWNEKPPTEEEAEAMQARSDLLVDRIAARLAREGDAADYEKIIREELARLHRERGELEPTEAQLAENAAQMEEMQRAAEEEADDPELAAEFDRKHPLAERTLDLTLRLMREPKSRGWATDDTPEEHPLVALTHGVMKAGAKLAGALNGGGWPPDLEFCAGKLVRLKRARGYLTDALAAAADAAEQRLAAAAWLDDICVETEAVAHETDALIAELRERLRPAE